MTQFQATVTFPIWSKKFGQYSWPGLELKQDTNKGKGVFATKKIPEGMLIPYLGNVVSPKCIQRLRNSYTTKANMKRYGAEFVKKRFQFLSELNKFLLIDGYTTNPFEEKLFIASFINEPSPHQKTNCTMICLLDKTFNCNFIMTTKEIRKGEELTVYYGPLYCNREYKIGSCSIQPHNQPKDLIVIQKKKCETIYGS